MALLRDRTDSIWIGTLDKGLSRYNPTTRSFTYFRHDPEIESSLSSDGVMSLFEDSRGNLWVGTFKGGLDMYRRDTNSFAHHPHDPKGLAGPASPMITCDRGGHRGRDLGRYGWWRAQPL